MRLSKILAAVFQAIGNFLNWSYEVGKAAIRYPFELLGFSGSPMPYYESESTRSDVVEEFKHARSAAAAVHSLDRDGIETVIKYANATPSARMSMDLSAVRAGTRATLLTMDNNELRALADAGIGAIRKFSDGKDHGIHGVPVASEIEPVVANDVAPEGMTRDEAVIWKVRAQLEKGIHSRQFSSPRL